LGIAAGCGKDEVIGENGLWFAVGGKPEEKSFCMHVMP
jgi:hypothetical protein